nr:hypothetical protein [Angustibacter aerolatus]
MRALPEDAWRPLCDAHEARVDVLTAGRRERAGRGQKHPVEDFLFTYYSHSVGALRQWHPGPGVVLLGAPLRRWYREVPTPDGLGVEVDVQAFLAARGDTLRFVERLLSATASRPAQARLLRPARVGDGLPAAAWRAAARGLAAAARPRRHRRGRRAAPRALQPLRRVPLLHRAGSLAQCGATDARAAGRARAARLPARDDGPLQVGLQARPARAVVAGARVLRAWPATSASLDMRASPTTWPPSATSRCASRPPPAAPSTPPPSAASPSGVRRCAPTCWPCWPPGVPTRGQKHPPGPRRVGDRRVLPARRDDSPCRGRG